MLCRITKLDLGPEIDVAELRNVFLDSAGSPFFQVASDKRSILRLFWIT